MALLPGGGDPATDEELHFRFNLNYNIKMIVIEMKHT